MYTISGLNGFFFSFFFLLSLDCATDSYNWTHLVWNLTSLRRLQLVIGHGKLLSLVEDTFEDLTDKLTAAIQAHSAREDHVYMFLFLCFCHHFSITLLLSGSHNWGLRTLQGEATILLNTICWNDCQWTRLALWACLLYSLRKENNPERTWNHLENWFEHTFSLCTVFFQMGVCGKYI